MNKKGQFIFWVLILGFLVVYFGSLSGRYIQAFYFASAIYPVTIGTAYFFSQYLLPKYLLPKYYRKFVLYLLYTIIISLYLEVLILFLSLIIFANYQMEGWNALQINLLQLSVVSYLVVLLNAFIHLFLSFQEEKKILVKKEVLLKEQHSQIEKLKAEGEKNDQTHIDIRANRQQYRIELKSITYIESVGDYVKIISEREELLTKMRISQLSKELPDDFIRIHRAFLVNQSKISGYTREYILIHDLELPISRTYRKAVIEMLSENTVE